MSKTSLSLYGGVRRIAYVIAQDDATAPSFTISPYASFISNTTVHVSATITDDSMPVTLYAVAVADGAGAPSAAQIKAGTDSLGAAAPNATGIFALSGSTNAAVITGLTASTAYDIYYVASDRIPNDTSPAKIDVTTSTSFDAQDMVSPCRLAPRMVRPCLQDVA